MRAAVTARFSLPARRLHGARWALAASALPARLLSSAPGTAGWGLDRFPPNPAILSVLDPATFGAATMSANTQGLLEGLVAGDRASLAKAITLIESTREDHRRQAELLLDALLDRRAGESARPSFAPTVGTSAAPSAKSRSFRVGIAGPPGAGKSTLIEALGMHLVRDKGLRVAVIAVDPSSSRTGGSILGDKTRMTELSRHPSAYVRPSPTRGALGGVAQHTNDVVLLCEGAGYDVVLVETVGLGQSEVTVDATVDMLLLVVPPAGGDELQGVKKGIVEVADAIIVNKADGDLATPARHAAAEYRRALQLVRWKHAAWQPAVARASALTGDGIPGVWELCTSFKTALEGDGSLEARRRTQATEWMWNQLDAGLVALAHRDPRVAAVAAGLGSKLSSSALTPRRAGHELLRAFVGACTRAGNAAAAHAEGQGGKAPGEGK